MGRLLDEDKVIKAIEAIPEGNWANKRYVSAVKHVEGWVPVVGDPVKELIYKDTARRIIDSPRSKEQMLRILESAPPVVDDVAIGGLIKILVNLIKEYSGKNTEPNGIRFYIPESETIPTDLALYVGNVYVKYERLKACTFRFEILTDDEDEAMVVVQKIIDQMIADHDEAHHGVTWETVSLETVPQEGRFNISTIFDWKYRVRDSY